MSIPFKLHKTLSIEISHYISCKDNDCERCDKLINDINALKVKRND